MATTDIQYGARIGLNVAVDVLGLAKEGQKIEAIRRIREVSDWGLAVSLAVYNDLAEPAAVKAEAPPTNIIDDILAELSSRTKSMTTNELRETLKAIVEAGASASIVETAKGVGEATQAIKDSLA